MPLGGGIQLQSRRCGKFSEGSDRDFGSDFGELVYDPALGHVL